MEERNNRKSADYNGYSNNICNRCLCSVAFAALTLFLSLFFLFTLRVHGDIVTDGSVGPARILSGPDFTIPQSLGTISKNNLFHSFKNFSISETQSATFTGDHGIANVISRVTGGEISTIDGMLRSTVGDADFFFINPSGIIFGPHAKVDVPAAFHVSTAEELLFDDGSVLNTSPPEASTLTQARPESFGFTGAKPATIEINGTVLEFVPDSEISLSSSDIIIQPYEGSFPALLCENGDIQITALGNNCGNVPLQGNPLHGTIPFDIVNCNTDNTITDNIDSLDAGGQLVIDSARLNVSGDGSGNLLIQATGDARINNSLILSDNTGDTDAWGDIEIEIGRKLELSHGSRIESNVSGKGDAGNITISAGDMTVGEQDGAATITDENATGIISNVSQGSWGEAATIEVSVSGRLDIINGGEISSSTWSMGDAGDITIFAENIEINGQGYGAGIVSHANEGAQGGAGAIEIRVSKLLNMMNNGYISSSAWSMGDAGNITIFAENIKINGQGKAAGIFSQVNENSQGNAGAIEITVSGLLELMNRGNISSSTWSVGNAGDITISGKNITIDGQGNLTGIFSDANVNTQGSAGKIEITVSGLLETINFGYISNDTYSKGDAGSIVVSAENITIDGQGELSGIFSTAKPGSEGDAGTIEVTVSGLLGMINGGRISSDTWSWGDAGSITISAENITIDGQGNHTGIISNAIAIKNSDNIANAGTIEITVSGLLDVMNGGTISNATWSGGDAGSITISAENIKIDGKGELSGIFSTAEPDSQGDAGTIEITVSRQFDMMNTGYVSSSTWSRGDAGNITVFAEHITIDGHEETAGAGFFNNAQEDYLQTESTEVLQGNAFGNVGNISMEADSITLANGAEISIAVLHSPIQDGQLDHAYFDDTYADQKQIFLKTKKLKLDEKSKVTSESTGRKPASDIFIQAEDLVVKNSSSITTSAENADGGDITIQGKNLFLHHGLITTSVNDINGDGGDITLQGMTRDESADYLVMKHGFIQANSAAKDARGGNINLEINGIIPDKTHKPLSLEDPQRQDFEKDPLVNVIQAAAPGGTKGEVRISGAPELDISGTIVNMNTQLTSPAGLATDPCLMLSSRKASSLIQEPKNGFLEWPENPSTIFFDSKRLKNLLSLKKNRRP